jgi:hypothetical protein
MNEKKTFKQEVKDWWQDNKKAIKAGITCGVIGILYGMVKGMTAADNMWLRNGYSRAGYIPDKPSDELGLTEENCDDPELLEVVNFENENS